MIIIIKLSLRVMPQQYWNVRKNNYDFIEVKKKEIV